MLEYLMVEEEIIAGKNQPYNISTLQPFNKILH